MSAPLDLGQGRCRDANVPRKSGPKRAFVRLMPLRFDSVYDLPLLKFSLIDSTISLATRQLRLSAWSAALRNVSEASFSSPLISAADNNSDASSSKRTDSLTCSAASATARGLVASNFRRSPLRLSLDFFFAIVVLTTQTKSF